MIENLDLQRKQMAEVLTNHILYDFFKGVYYLHGYKSLEEIRKEANNYAVKDEEADLEEFREAIPFFKENNLIEDDSKHNNPDKFQISAAGKSLFYKIFDMQVFKKQH